MIASEISVDQPIGKIGILYDCDMLNMHNSAVGVIVLMHIVQTTMLDLQHKQKLVSIANIIIC